MSSIFTHGVIWGLRQAGLSVSHTQKSKKSFIKNLTKRFKNIKKTKKMKIKHILLSYKSGQFEFTWVDSKHLEKTLIRST